MTWKVAIDKIIWALRMLLVALVIVAGVAVLVKVAMILDIKYLLMLHGFTVVFIAISWFSHSQSETIDAMEDHQDRLENLIRETNTELFRLRERIDKWER